EVLYPEVEEAHDEAADGEAVGHDEDAVGVLALHLPHHRFEEARGAVVAVGRALAAAKPVVEPAVGLAQLFLRLDRLVAVLDLAQPRIVVHPEAARLVRRQAAALEDALQGLARAAVRRHEEEGAAHEVGPEGGTDGARLLVAARRQRDGVIAHLVGELLAGVGARLAVADELDGQRHRGGSYCFCSFWPSAITSLASTPALMAQVASFWPAARPRS